MTTLILLVPQKKNVTTFKQTPSEDLLERVDMAEHSLLGEKYEFKIFKGLFKYGISKKTYVNSIANIYNEIGAKTQAVDYQNILSTILKLKYFNIWVIKKLIGVT